jgi:hypothetical protein
MLIFYDGPALFLAHRIFMEGQAPVFRPILERVSTPPLGPGSGVWGWGTHGQMTTQKVEIEGLRILSF